MTDHTVSPGQPIRATHINQFSRWLTAQVKSHTTSITNTHATEYTAVLTNEQTSAGNALKLVSGASNVALFSKTGTAIYATGTAVFRPIGTADQTVAGTWIAATGSTQVTGAGDLTANLVRDQAVWIGGRVFTAASVTYNATAATTALLLSATYTGASGTVAMLTDASEAFSIRGSNGGLAFEVTTKGDWRSRGTHNVPAGWYEDSVDATIYNNGFFWSNANRRLYIPTLVLTRTGDPVDIAIRASGESVGYPDGAPTQNLSGANMGAMYWQGYISSSAGWQYRSAVIYCRAGQDSTTTGAAGSIVIGTTRQNQTAPTDSWTFLPEGYLQGANALEIGWLMSGSSTFIRSFDVDTGNNLNIARDNNIADTNFFGRTIWYRTATTVTEVFRVDETGVIIGNQSGGTLGVSGAATFLTRATFLAGGISVTGVSAFGTTVTFTAAAITSPAISLVDTNPSTGNALTARGPAKAWASFSYDGTAVTVAASYNITAVTRITTGHYGVTWATVFSSAEYALGGLVYSSNNRFKQHILTQTVSTATLQVTGSANDTVGDPSGTWRIFVTAHGMQ